MEEKVKATTVGNPLKDWRILTSGFLATTAIIGGLAWHLLTREPPLPRSYHPVPASYGVSQPFISSVAYESFPLVLSPVATQAIAIPYAALAGAPAITEQVTVPCFSMLPRAPKKETITMTGVHLGGLLVPQIAQAKEAGFNALELNSRDGQQLIVPFGKDTTQVYLSASSDNLSRKHADTPYDVLAVVNGEARHINSVDSIKFSYKKDFVLQDKDLGVAYEFHKVDDLLKEYNFQKRDSIPLSDFGENNAYKVVAMDAYHNSFSPELAPHAIIVKDDNVRKGESPYSIFAPELGRSSEVRNIDEIGIASLEKKVAE